jgi:hypothetical protein
MVNSKTLIDTEFDFRQEVGGKDPDAHSPTLKQYHQILWHKPLPNGRLLQISNIKSKYLVGTCEDKSIDLSSDSIINSLSKRLKNNSETSQIYMECRSEIEKVQKNGSNIGGFLLFPRRKIDGKLTINAARGFNTKIIDRFDLSLECIRLYFLGLDSPLKNHLERYSEFFGLFNNFKGYVQFFLLDDLVNDSYTEVKFFTSFSQAFSNSPLPNDKTEYQTYAENSLKFVRSRNQRIKQWHLEEISQSKLPTA